MGVRWVVTIPRTPRRARFWLGLAAVYLASPVDLVPDWIPVVGWLDELAVIPALLWMARRSIPDVVLTECRRQAADSVDPPPRATEPPCAS